MGFHHIGQAGLKLLTSGDLLTAAFQRAEITGVSHCAQLFFFLRRSFALLLRLECNGVIFAQCSLCLLGSCVSPDSTSGVAVITGAHHHAWLIFIFLVETGFHHVAQAGLKLLTLGDHPPQPPKVLELQA